MLEQISEWWDALSPMTKVSLLMFTCVVGMIFFPRRY